jgi:hypothetical protein
MNSTESRDNSYMQLAQDTAGGKFTGIPVSGNTDIAAVVDGKMGRQTTR